MLFPAQREYGKTIGTGEITWRKPPGLATFDLSSVLWRDFMKRIGSKHTPKSVFRQFMDWRSSGKYSRVTITGIPNRIDIRANCIGVETMNRGIEHRDIYYTVNCIQWITSKVRALKKNPTPPRKNRGNENKAPVPSSYIIVRGDTLSGISRRFAEDSSKWPELYNQNRKVVGSNPHLIFPGTKLVIPASWRS